MTTSMIKPIGYLLLRWRLVVALLGGVLAAMMMLLFVSIQQTDAQTTGPVQAIAAGAAHGLAIVNDPVSGSGTVYGWGDNNAAQLGDGTYYNNRFPPVRVHGAGDVGYLTGVKAIGASGHGLAVKSDDTVYAWGSNSCGVLGIGTIKDSTTPVQVHGAGDVGYLTGVTDVAAGPCASFALKSDGTVYAWGDNEDGQLGVGGDDTYTSPTQVKGLGGAGVLTNVKAIAAGNMHSLFLTNDGTVYGVGANSYGQLGIGNNTLEHDTLVEVKGPSGSGEDYLTDVVAIAAGVHHSMAVKSDGTVYAWGGNGYGQLGIGNKDPHTIPYQVLGGEQGTEPLKEPLTGITDVAAGEHHSLAVRGSDGSVWAWGGNNNGQLGIGNKSNHTVPYQVHGLNDVGTLSGISDVAAGQYFSMALKDDGTAVYAWGGNFYKQIDASRNDRTYPVQVSGIAGATPPEPTGGKTAICHKPETPHAKTLNVPSSALKVHLRHGDDEGSCE